MTFTFPTEFTPKGVDEAQQRIEAFLKGSRELPTAAEQGLLETATEVRGSSLAQLNKKPADRAAQATFAYAAAVVRGINYARAGRGRLLALGANNALQELYELKKAFKNAGVT